MQNKRKKKLIVANSLLLAVLIFGTAFAWFASNYKNSVASNEVQVIADGDLLLSVDPGTEKNWSNSISLSNKEWFKRTNFTDITGSGNGTFVRPTLELRTNDAIVDADGTWTTPKVTDTSDNAAISEKYYDYVRFTLYMKSNTKYAVTLGPGSSVNPASSSKLSDLLGADAPNAITLTREGASPLTFSKDLVAGAVRVSAIDGSNHKFTWIPRPEIYASNVAAGTYAGAIDSVVVNKTSGESYSHKFYSNSGSAYTQKNLASGLTVTGNITNASQQTLVTLQDDGTGENYTGQIDICIWLEGCDNEARRAFVDGKFKVYLNLVAINA
ncbi:MULTISPECIES: hypothetical protein [unclassified Ruminococcus]|uniref:hypothetical protein n=1 Tax=unclassified Ruminococcus TaxID=2608920 RepID=UPI00210B7569|nr:MULTISPECIES: hypothetical protein [unclassified Ruminococcus]MCQ4021516.1 hypothetical protein [Ruminococcus sp. zg-924]MCQ4113961.1 hypothetical protein [Ruminococcus sp. zg-921]